MLNNLITENRTRKNIEEHANEMLLNYLSEPDRARVPEYQINGPPQADAALAHDELQVKKRQVNITREKALAHLKESNEKFEAHNNEPDAFNEIFPEERNRRDNADGCIQYYT